MTEQGKIEYHQLYAGFEFPPQSYELNSQVVSLYLEAVKESHSLFHEQGFVPPMAVTALAMASLSKSISMPPGTIHVSQELDFLRPVRTGEKVTCYSKVSRKVDRGGLRLMNTDINVKDESGNNVLTGRVGFVLPEPGLQGGN